MVGKNSDLKSCNKGRKIFMLVFKVNKYTFKETSKKTSIMIIIYNQL